MNEWIGGLVVGWTGLMQIRVNGQTNEWLDRDCCSSAWNTDNRKNENICGLGVSFKLEFNMISQYQSLVSPLISQAKLSHLWYTRLNLVSSYMWSSCVSLCVQFVHLINVIQDLLSFDKKTSQLIWAVLFQVILIQTYISVHFGSSSDCAWVVYYMIIIAPL